MTRVMVELSRISEVIVVKQQGKDSCPVFIRIAGTLSRAKLA